MIELIIGLIIGLILGGAAVGAIVHFRVKSQVVEAQTTAKNYLEMDVIKDSKLEEMQRRLSAEGEARVKAVTELEEARRSLDEQKRRLDESVARLTETFKSLSQDVLRSNSQEFLERARESLGKVLSDTKGEMGGLVTPLRDALSRYETQVRDIESKRVDAYSGLKSNLESLAKAQRSLEQQTTSLAQALKAPTIRGKWGEVVLERVLELSGLPPECVEKQVSVSGEEGTQRPDVVVRFPGERCIVIDSKAPLDAYLAATETQDPDLRRAKLAAHAVAVRQHVRALSNKAYWDRFPTAEFVVLFMPAESILSAAVEEAPGLIEEAMESHVILATPTSLIAALHTVAHTWRQFRLAEGARKIADAGVELYDRLCTFVDYLASIRTGLDKATDAYNKAVGSWERRVEPAARRLKELGAAKPDQELPELGASETALRQLPPGGDGGEKPAS
jgi:DNA recombination protein RmuC